MLCAFGRVTMPPVGAAAVCVHAGMGHCTFQKYAAGVVCMPPSAGARESRAGSGGPRVWVGVGERAIFLAGA